MAFRTPRFLPSIQALPVRSWPYRASLLLLVAMSCGLLLLSQNNNPAAVRLRLEIAAFAAPVAQLLASPLQATAGAVDAARQWVNLREENRMLKQQNLQLMQWQQSAKQLQSENEALRRILPTVPVTASASIAAFVVADSAGAYVHSVLINAGSNQGVKKNQAVMNEQGLVGRVIEVSPSHSRVLLITDINSRLPVMGEESHDKAILLGDNNHLPLLEYLSTDHRLEDGSRLVTSGDGGALPANLPVGIVVKGEGSQLKLQPYASLHRLVYVNVVDFEL